MPKKPSILVTDVRQQPHTQTRITQVSLDAILSNTSEVPSGRKRAPRPRQSLTQTPNLPVRLSKVAQKHVLIPNEEQTETTQLTSAEQLPRDARSDFPRVTSYLIAETFNLRSVADFARHHHRARVRLYNEAVFLDYLQPLVACCSEPGVRVQSSRGDNRRMEQRINASEQGDHHYEYFSSLEPDYIDDDEFDPSEPQDFSPRESYKPRAPQQIKEPKPPPFASNLAHSEVFVFNYGAIVFWNFTPNQERTILADLTMGPSAPLTRNLYADHEIEVEEFNFRYATDVPRPRIFNDMITLTSASHMVKLAMSHSIAQSTKLSRFEELMQTTMHDVKYVPKTLALTGKLPLKRSQLVAIAGRLFQLRVAVNLGSNVLDIPDFFWESEPSLNPLYTAVRQYLEIDRRILVLNERCQVFLDLTGILTDTVSEFNMDRITLIIIWLIVISIVVTLGEIVVRYMLVLREKF